MPTPIPNIWQLQSRGDIDGLIEALRHPEPTVRKNASAALRALGAWQAVPALEAALAAEQDWQAHAAITAALQYLDHDLHVETMVKNKDIRGLSKMLTSPRQEDIMTACKALADIGDRRAAESLVMVFRSPLIPNQVRLAAAEALLKLESAPAVVTLLGALRRDNWQVRRNAAAVLGQLQATWATQPLIEALNDENQAVRRTAAAALRRFGTPDAVAAANKFDEMQAKMVTQEMQDGEDGEPTAPSQRATQTAAQTANAPTEPLPPSAAQPTAPAQPTAQPTPLGQTKVLPDAPAASAPPAQTDITITPPGQHQAPQGPIAPIITPPPATPEQPKPAFTDLARGDTGVLRRLRAKATGPLPQTGQIAGSTPAASSGGTAPIAPSGDKPKADSAPLVPTPTPPPTATPPAADNAPLAPTTPAPSPAQPSAATTPTQPSTQSTTQPTKPPTQPLTPPPPSIPELPPEKPKSDS